MGGASSGREEARGMWIEGQRHGFAARNLGNASGFCQQGLVAKVHAIEIADGHGRAAQRSAQVLVDAVASSYGMHSLRDTGRIRLRQLSSFSTSCSLSHLIAPMTMVCRGATGLCWIRRSSLGRSSSMP
jgi:hypothetical protein